MIHLESCDRKIAIAQYDALADFLGQNGYSIRRSSVVRQAKPDVEFVSRFEMRDHVLRAPRSPHTKRPGSPWTYQPPCQPEVGKTDHMIGVEMRQEYAI